MLVKIKNFFNHLISRSISDDDTTELALKKRMLFIISLIVSSAGCLAGIIYLLLGHYIPAVFPLLYTCISIFGLVHLVKTKCLIQFQTAQLYSVLIIPFAMMWSLGGFEAGSFAILWAFYAPVAAVIYAAECHQKRWFLSFIALVIISILINDYLVAHITPPHSSVIKLFLVFNIIGSLGGIQLLISNFAQIKKVNTDLELKHEATHDALTALPNRVLFLNEMALSIADLEKSGNPMAIFVIALDRFKEINDSLGHSIGDKLLVEIAHHLTHDWCDNNFIARLSGDEFGVIVTRVQQGGSCVDLVEEILKSLQEPITIENHELYITSSIGIAGFPNDATTATTLLDCAYTAMHKTKDEGKNSYQYYTRAMTEQAHKRVLMITKLRQAIAADEFIVYYQPQYDVRHNTLTGMEALVRWNSPETGMVSPGEFIPLAEETGLIVELDRIVMKKAMAQFILWYKEGLNPGKISLNLSMVQLAENDLMDFLQKMLADADSEEPYLALEVTEGQIMKDPESAITLLNEISDLGIKLSIDDFGTGYSSLSYLKRLPISKLKIDQSFVRGLPDDEDDQAIVKSVIALAKSMNMSVIAEGVETIEQSNFLLENGCENIQGYYYGRPMPAEDVSVLLVSR